MNDKKFYLPVDRKKLKITSGYGMRNGVFHGAWDLRCWDFLRRKHQAFIATEDSIVLRVKRDKKDNGIVVLKPLWSEYTELKWIHINIEKCFVFEGQQIKAGHKLGYAEIRGQSKSLHLHWVTEINDRPVDPGLYADKYLS